MTESIEIHRTVIYKQQTAIELLASSGELPPEQLQQCFDNGAVWLQSTGKPQRIYASDTALKPGNRIHCYCNESTLAPCPFKPELIQDFGSFSVWNKPSGMLSQGSKWGDHWALYRWIKQHHWPERETFITHRLDRFTCGLMIVAHDAATNKQFHRLFESRAVKKTYRAIVSGVLQENKELTLDSPIDGKTALTRIKVLGNEPKNERSLVEIKPETGRKHQIRIHLAETGHPVLNDRNYGKPPFEGDLMLQASELEFSHPTDNNNIQLSLPSPQRLSLPRE